LECGDSSPLLFFSSARQRTEKTKAVMNHRIPKKAVRRTDFTNL